MKLGKKTKKKIQNKTGLSYLWDSSHWTYVPAGSQRRGKKKNKNRNSSSQFDANYKLSYEKKMRDMKEDFQATAMLNINTEGTMQKIQPEEDNLLSCRQEQQNKWPSAKHELQRNRWAVRLCPAKTAYNTEKQDFQTQETKRTMHHQEPPQHRSKSFSHTINDRVWKSGFISRKNLWR